MGSIEAARAAGSTEAARASASTNKAASASTSGSKRLTANSKESSTCAVAATPANPTAHPASASFRADRKTSPRIPERCYPKAMRMAISCTRSAAEKATTL